MSNPYGSGPAPVTALDNGAGVERGQARYGNGFDESKVSRAADGKFGTIGKTKSGKDIHEDGNHGGKSRGWSAEDHMDAFHAHTEKGMEHGDKKRAHPEFEANRWRKPEGGKEMMRTPEEAVAVSSSTLRDIAAKEDHHHAIADKHYTAAKKKGWTAAKKDGDE